MPPMKTIAPAASAELTDGAGRRKLPLEPLPFTIGRAPECSLVLAQSYVSRRHAEIQREGAGLVVVDAGSRHGTFVNRQRIVRHTLQPGDTLHFGSLDGPRLCLEDVTRRTTQRDILDQLKEFSGDKSEIEKLRWFLDAARELNSADQVDRVLASLLQTTLALAQVERGYVFLANASGALELALGMDAAGRLLEDSSTVSSTVLHKAAEGADRFIITDTLSAEGVASESIVAHSIRTVICIPLRQLRKRTGEGAHRKLLGVLYLDSRFQPERFTDIDHELLDTIAREAAALVENAQLAAIEEQARQQNEELQIAARIQQRLMAVQIPSLPYAAVEAHSVPCSSIGGDFFDVVAGKDTLCVALVDVSGKGISAAILASTLQGMLYTQLLAGQPLEAIAAATNHYLCAKNVGKYATMVVMRLHASGMLEYINCGHVQPRLCTAGSVVRMELANFPVGLLPTAVYSAATVTLQPGARVVLVSDGFTEAEDAQGNCFGEERFDEAVSCSELQRILQHMRDFCAAHPASDDCTVVQVAFSGLAPLPASPDEGAAQRGFPIR